VLTGTLNVEASDKDMPEISREGLSSHYSPHLEEER
jgi:hypothetical protein